ncbi:reverse transcriptase domain-containing protein [Tanacetum coccineum]|uniref:Reverse transcriptase domain-containing protein n=1 Tax=Tanacetum coccineum TaxID=301880 RepID=A0ABQ5G9P7_9ASTR
MRRLVRFLMISFIQWRMQHQPSIKQIMTIMVERDATIQERNLAISEKRQLSLRVTWHSCNEIQLLQNEIVQSWNVTMPSLSVKCYEAFVGLFWEAKHQIGIRAYGYRELESIVVRLLLQLGVGRLRRADGVTTRYEFQLPCGRDDTITRVPGKFQDYETSEEEPVEQPRRHDLYGFVDHPQLQQGNPMNEFVPHRLPQPKGNMNGWLIEDEEEVERNEVDSDLESTVSSKPVWEKTTKDDHDRASRNCP